MSVRVSPNDEDELDFDVADDEESNEGSNISTASENEVEQRALQNTSEISRHPFDSQDLRSSIADPDTADAHNTSSWSELTSTTTGTNTITKSGQRREAANNNHNNTSIPTPSDCGIPNFLVKSRLAVIDIDKNIVTLADGFQRSADANNNSPLADARQPIEKQIKENESEHVVKQSQRTRGQTHETKAQIITTTSIPVTVTSTDPITGKVTEKQTTMTMQAPDLFSIPIPPPPPAVAVPKVTAPETKTGKPAVLPTTPDLSAIPIPPPPPQAHTVALKRDDLQTVSALRQERDALAGRNKQAPVRKSGVGVRKFGGEAHESDDDGNRIEKTKNEVIVSSGQTHETRASIMTTTSIPVTVTSTDPITGKVTEKQTTMTMQAPDLFSIPIPPAIQPTRILSSESSSVPQKNAMAHEAKNGKPAVLPTTPDLSAIPIPPPPAPTSSKQTVLTKSNDFNADFDSNTEDEDEEEATGSKGNNTAPSVVAAIPTVASKSKREDSAEKKECPAVDKAIGGTQFSSAAAGGTSRNKATGRPPKQELNDEETVLRGDLKAKSAEKKREREHDNSHQTLQVLVNEAVKELSTSDDMGATIWSAAQQKKENVTAKPALISPSPFSPLSPNSPLSPQLDTIKLLQRLISEDHQHQQYGTPRSPTYHKSNDGPSTSPLASQLKSASVAPSYSPTINSTSKIASQQAAVGESPQLKVQSERQNDKDTIKSNLSRPPPPPQPPTTAPASNSHNGAFNQPPPSKTAHRSPMPSVEKNISTPKKERDQQASLSLTSERPATTVLPASPAPAQRATPNVSRRSGEPPTPAFTIADSTSLTHFMSKMVSYEINWANDNGTATEKVTTESLRFLSQQLRANNDVNPLLTAQQTHAKHQASSPKKEQPAAGVASTGMADVRNTTHYPKATRIVNAENIWAEGNHIPQKKNGEREYFSTGIASTIVTSTATTQKIAEQTRFDTAVKSESRNADDCRDTRKPTQTECSENERMLALERVQSSRGPSTITAETSRRTPSRVLAQKVQMSSPQSAQKQRYPSQTNQWESSPSLRGNQTHVEDQMSSPPVRPPDLGSQAQTISANMNGLSYEQSPQSRDGGFTPSVTPTVRVAPSLSLRVPPQSANYNISQSKEDKVIADTRKDKYEPYGPNLTPYVTSQQNPIIVAGNSHSVAASHWQAPRTNHNHDIIGHVTVGNTPASLPEARAAVPPKNNVYHDDRVDIYDDSTPVQKYARVSNESPAGQISLDPQRMAAFYTKLEPVAPPKTEGFYATVVETNVPTRECNARTSPRESPYPYPSSSRGTDRLGNVHSTELNADVMASYYANTAGYWPQPQPLAPHQTQQEDTDGGHDYGYDDWVESHLTTEIHKASEVIVDGEPVTVVYGGGGARAKLVNTVRQSREQGYVYSQIAPHQSNTLKDTEISGFYENLLGNQNVSSRTYNAWHVNHDGTLHSAATAPAVLSPSKRTEPPSRTAGDYGSTTQNSFLRAKYKAPFAFINPKAVQVNPTLDFGNQTESYDFKNSGRKAHETYVGPPSADQSRPSQEESKYRYPSPRGPAGFPQDLRSFEEARLKKASAGLSNTNEYPREDETSSSSSSINYDYGFVDEKVKAPLPAKNNLLRVPSPPTNEYPPAYVRYKQEAQITQMAQQKRDLLLREQSQRDLLRSMADTQRERIELLAKAERSIIEEREAVTAREREERLDFEFKRGLKWIAQRRAEMSHEQNAVNVSTPKKLRDPIKLSARTRSDPDLETATRNGTSHVKYNNSFVNQIRHDVGMSDSNRHPDFDDSGLTNYQKLLGKYGKESAKVAAHAKFSETPNRRESQGSGLNYSPNTERFLQKSQNHHQQTNVPPSSRQGWVPPNMRGPTETSIRRQDAHESSNCDPHRTVDFFRALDLSGSTPQAQRVALRKLREQQLQRAPKMVDDYSPPHYSLPTDNNMVEHRRRSRHAFGEISGISTVR